MVTSGGSTVWQWKNDNPYGNNMAQGTIEFNLRFSGQYYDSESGLNYNINRTYDPETGRYLQSDPIGLAGGFNTYNYAERNPLSAIDPDGHMPLLIPVIGAVAGGLSNGLNYYSQGKNPWTGAIIGAGVGAAAAYTEPALAASAIGRAAMRYVSADAIAGAIGGAGTQLLNRIAGVNLIDTGHPAQDCILETVMSAGVGGIFGGIFSSLADGSAMSSANAFIRTYSDEFKAGFVSAYSTSYTNLVNAYANLAGVLR